MKKQASYSNCRYFHAPELVIGLNTAEEYKQKGCMALLHTGSSVSMTTREDHGCRDEPVLSLDICSYCIVHAYRLTYAHRKCTCESVMGHGPARRLSEQLIRAVQQRGVEGGRREAQSAEAWLRTDYLPLWSSRLYRAERGERHELVSAHSIEKCFFLSITISLDKNDDNEIMCWLTWSLSRWLIVRI